MVSDEELYRLLEARLGRLHLRQRLGIERDHETRVFGQGLNFFHLENWYSIHSVIRNTLRVFALLGRGRRNALAIQVRHNPIAVMGLPKAFRDFTILHISDLHLDINAHMPAALAERVRGLRYDLTVITGDIRAKTFGSAEAALAGMRAVRAQLSGPVYGVLGNHDSIRMVPALEEMGVRMLLNETELIARGGAAIYLSGIDDPHYYRADNLEKAAAALPPDAVSILLSHSPEMYKHAAHASYRVMLCGHTHGGQICLPGGIPLLCNVRAPRRMCAGAWNYHGLAGYTSAGSGACIVDARLNCPPEVTLHRLHDGSA